MAIALERSDMKKFNIDYTTPEQSMRLLELGIPANSADCYYDHFGYKNIRDCEFELASNFFDNSIQKYYYKYDGAIPCWSVGRLMEIWHMCKGWRWVYMTDRAIIDEIVEDFELLNLDFSKLEW